MLELTSSEIAGFSVGGLLLYTTISAPKIDAFISASQSSLGMCKKCGNLRMIACSRCRGVGAVKKGRIINLDILDYMFDDQSSTKEMEPCIKCEAKGRLPCPNCSKP